MRVGLAISMFVHALLIGWGVSTMVATEKLEPPPTPVIEARLVTVGEFTNLRKGDPNSRKMDAEPAEPKTKAAKDANKPPTPKAPPPPSAPPPPDPIAEKLKQEEARKAAEEAENKKALEQAAAEQAAAKALEKRRAEDEARKKAQEEARKKAEEERKKKLAASKKREAERKKKLAEAKKRAEEKKKKQKFDADAIRQALLDKTPEKRGGAKERARAGERDGTGDQLTAREQDLILSRISQALGACWRLPGAGGGVRVPVVVLRWTMREDGTVKGPPIVVQNPGGTLARQAEEAAKRALICVGQFDLPREHYRSWRVLEFAFDPSAMVSGTY